MTIEDQWKSVHDDAVRLCDFIEHIPEDCPCGEADEHLAGRCSCCGGHSRGSHEPPQATECTELVSTVRAGLELLCERFKTTAGELDRSARDDTRPIVRLDLNLIAGDLGHLLARLEGLDHAVVGFRRTCAVTEMQRIKRQGAALRSHCERLGGLLRQGSETP